MDDLVEREGLFYEKFTVVPFTGKIDEGLERGSFQNGKRDGLWVGYYENGQLEFQGDFRDGVRDGPWVHYRENGQLWSEGTFKDGKEEGLWIRSVFAKVQPNSAPLALGRTKIL